MNETTQRLDKIIELLERNNRLLMEVGGELTDIQWCMPVDECATCPRLDQEDEMRKRWENV